MRVTRCGCWWSPGVPAAIYPRCWRPRGCWPVAGTRSRSWRRVRRAAPPSGWALRSSAFAAAPIPTSAVAFEAQAELVMATAAGTEIALDVRDAIERAAPRPDRGRLHAPGRAGGRPGDGHAGRVAGPLPLRARSPADARGRGRLDHRSGHAGRTRGSLGLGRLEDGVAAWEAADLVLVTAPGWLDLDAGAPGHVVHAGPLGVDVRRQRGPRGEQGRPRLLLTFSTTVMEGQAALIETPVRGRRRPGAARHAHPRAGGRPRGGSRSPRRWRSCPPRTMIASCPSARS